MGNEISPKEILSWTPNIRRREGRSRTKKELGERGSGRNKRKRDGITERS